MLKSLPIVFFVLIAIVQSFPYESIRCSPPMTLTSVETGTRLTLGSHNKSGDFVHVIGDQYVIFPLYLFPFKSPSSKVVLSDHPDAIVYPDPPRAYDRWDICNCGVRNNASSFFLMNGGDSLAFTGYMFLNSPYAALIPVPGTEFFVISSPTPGCEKCVLTVNVNNRTVEVRHITDESTRKLQYWKATPNCC